MGKARVREIALASFIQVTAQSCIQRSLTSQTRTTGESLEWETGMLVDTLYRTPVTQYMIGWRGPCLQLTCLASTTDRLTSSGTAERWRSESKTCGKHIAYWFVLATFHDHWLPLRNFRTGIQEQDRGLGHCTRSGRGMRCGNGDNATVSACELGTTAQGWKLSTAARKRPELFANDLRLANVHPGTHACMEARFDCATVAAQVLLQIGFTHIVFWNSNDCETYNTTKVWKHSVWIATIVWRIARHDTYRIRTLSVDEGARREIDNTARTETLDETIRDSNMDDDMDDDYYDPGHQCREARVTACNPEGKLKIGIRQLNHCSRCSRPRVDPT